MEGVKSRQLRRWQRVALVCAMLVVSGTAFSQSTASWPSRPVKFVVGFPPGTPGDVTARAMVPYLFEALKQPVVVENRPGAGGVVAAQSVASGPADGYTFLVGPDTILTVNPHLYRKVGYGPDTLRTVMTVATLSMVLTCHPSTGIKSLQSLVELGKKRELNYSSGGHGVPGHLVMELFLQSTKLRMNHVPYKGPAPAALGLLAGEVDCGFLSSNQVAPHLASGKLIGLAVSGRSRSLLVPSLPTLEEAGLPSFDGTFAEVIYAAAGVPETVVERLRGALLEAMTKGPVKESLLQQDMRIVGDRSQESADRIRRESARWAALIRELDLKIE